MGPNVDRAWRRVVVAATVLLAGLLPGGCVTETRTEQGGVVKVEAPRERRQQTPRQTVRPRDPSAPPLPNDATDPCALRLHDISGLLLTYYAVHKQLPERMDELAAFADAEVQFKPECPESGRPYVFAPQGLQTSAGGDRYLIIYDAVPAHGGLRWGVFVAPPKGGQPPATWVILMSEEVFRGYVPASR